MSCLLYYCFVADLCRLGPLEASGSVGAQCHCECIAGSNIYLFAHVRLRPEVVAGNLYGCSSGRGASRQA